MYMYEKKTISFVSPDLKKLQAVIIDARTTIFIDKYADPIEARRRYAQWHPALKV